jgi:hypothetical protein
MCSAIKVITCYLFVITIHHMAHEVAFCKWRKSAFLQEVHWDCIGTDELITTAHFGIQGTGETEASSVLAGDIEN